MATAFVLSGGASLGAIQVGMARGLFEHGIRPDILIGTSAGAINAAVLAQGFDCAHLDELAGVWRSLKRQTVFPFDPLRGFLGFFGQRNYLCSPGPLRRLLGEHIRYDSLEHAAISVHMVATDLHSGREVLLSRGPTIDAVMASAALPGVFPPVPINDDVLIDGGVSNNAPLSHAVRLGADEVYLLTCGHACALPRPPKSALGVLLQSMSVLIGRQLVHDIERYEPTCRLHVVPQLCPLGISPIDFRHADELGTRAYESTMAWLSRPRSSHGQGALVEPHVHRYST